MPEVLISPDAQAELDAIYNYIADDNAQAAEQMARRFDRTFKFLAQNPFLGRDRSRFLLNARSLTIGNYVIFYSLIEDGVEILHVLHGRRDIQRILRGISE